MPINNQLSIYDLLDEDPPFKERHHNDLYETHENLTLELLERVEIKGTILEPCCGNNAIARVLERNLANVVIGTDITLDTFCMPNDASTNEYWQAWQLHFYEYYGFKGIEWVVTNPPFSLAHEILPLALENCSVGVAFLLRNSYTEPCQNRKEWLIANCDRMRYRFDINPRPQFRKEKGGDKASVVWLVWLKDWSWKKLGIDPPFQFITDWREKNDYRT